MEETVFKLKPGLKGTQTYEDHSRQSRNATQRHAGLEIALAKLKGSQRANVLLGGAGGTESRKGVMLDRQSPDCIHRL